MADNDAVSVSIGGTVAPSLQQSTDAAKAAIADLASAVRKAQAAIRASSDDIGSGVGKGADEAATGLNKVSHASTGVRREMIVMAHELATGNYTRLGGSLMVMAERMNGAGIAGQALGAIMSPLGLVIAGVAAAAIGVAIEMAKGAQEMRTFNNQMAATSGFAGLTSSAFEGMAESIAASTGTSISGAREQLSKLIGTGRFTGDTLRLVGVASVDMAKLTGQSADKFVEYFSKMGEDVASFAASYSAHYGQITEAQLDHIQKLQDEGNTAEATKAFFEDINNYLAGEGVQKLVQYKSWWDKIGDAINSAADAIKNYGRQQTPVEKLAQTNSELEGAYRAKAHGAPLEDGRIAQLQAQAAAQAKAVEDDDRQAAARQKIADTNKQAVAAEHELAQGYEQTRSSGEKLGAVTEHINQLRAKALAGNTGGAAGAAQINTQADAMIAEAKRRDGPPKGPKGPSQYSLDESALSDTLAEEKNWYGDRDQLTVNFWQDRIAKEKAAGQDTREQQKALNAALEALDKQTFDQRLASDKTAIEESANNPAKLQQAWANYFSDLLTRYKVDSTQYQEAVREKEKADQEAAARRREAQIEQNDRQASGAITASRTTSESTVSHLDAEKTQLDDEGGKGGVGPKQLLAQTISIDQQIFAEKQAEADREYALAQAAVAKNLQIGGLTADQEKAQQDKAWANFQEYEAKKAALTKSTADKMADDQAAAAKKAQAAYEQSVSSMVDTVGSGFLGMARGTESWQQVEIKAAENVENQFAAMIEKRITAWIVGESQQSAATVAGNTQRAAADQAGASQSLLIGLEATLKKVTQNAVTAASGAYSAMAQIPIIGPALGAAAAAVTFTAVEAFGALASASGGYDIPSGVNPVTQLHAREMVLPASYADGFRKIISDYGGGGGSGSPAGASSGGSTHYNMAISALDSRSVRRMISDPRNVRAAAAAASGRR